MQILLLLFSNLLLFGCFETSDQSPGTATSSVTGNRVCIDAGGELEQKGDGQDDFYLCHFTDGTFCELGLLADGTCVPGQWPYPGPDGGDGLNQSQ